MIWECRGGAGIEWSKEEALPSEEKVSGIGSFLFVCVDGIWLGSLPFC